MDLIDDLIDMISAITESVRHWRITLSAIATSIFAYVIAINAPWISALQCVVIAFIGIIFGAEMGARKSPGAKPPVPVEVDQTTKLVAGGAAILTGVVWGVASSPSVPSFIVGICLFAPAAGAWSWYAGTYHTWFSKGRIRSCIVLAAVAYPISAALMHHTLSANPLF